MNVPAKTKFNSCIFFRFGISCWNKHSLIHLHTKSALNCVALRPAALFAALFFYPSSHNFHEFLSMTIFSFLHAPTIKRLFVQSTCICFRLFSSNHSHSNVTVIITFSIFFYHQFIFLFFIFISIEQTNKCQFCLI